MKLIITEKNFKKIILFFFVFATLFPTIRIITIGSQTSQNFGEYIFSVLPEILSVFVILFTVLLFYKNNIEIKLKIYDWLIIAFMISNVILGTYLAQNLFISMYGIRMTYYPIIFYFIFRFGNIKLIESLIHTIFIWFFIVGIIGFILYFGFYDLMLIMIKKTSPIIPEYFIVRMTSVFWTPVVFSTFMVITFAYFYHLFLKAPKWYYFLILGMIWCCIILSVSRGALVVLVVGFISLSVIHKKWKHALEILILLIVIFIALGYFISSPLLLSSWIAKSASETVGLKEGVTRVDLWLKAFENFETHPFGFGLGKAGHVATRFFNEETQNVTIYATDGWYLKTANETGLWGLLSYLFLALYFFVLFIKNKLLKNKESILIVFFVIFLMVNIQNIVSNVLDFYLFSYLYWGFIGLTLNIIYYKKKLI
ncbi:MAG: O-antigen ligase family protein [Bacteroidales bacterium]